MKVEKKTYYLWIIVISIIFIVMLLSVIHNDNKLDVSNTVSIIGSISSLAGIIIAYIEIISVKKISEQSRLAIKQAVDELHKTFSISDLSRNVKLTSEIQNLVRNKKFETSLYKMQDLKSFLIQLEFINIVNKIYNHEVYKKLMLDLGVDLYNLNSVLNKNKENIDTLALIHNLERISTFINELENNLKYNDNGR